MLEQNAAYIIPILSITLAAFTAVYHTQRRRPALQDKEQALGDYAERLRVLHEIDQAILTAQSPKTVAVTVLAYIHQLLPSERASVVAYDEENVARLLSIRADNGLATDGAIWEQALSLNGFDHHQIRRVNDLPNKASPSPLEQRLLAQGVGAYLLVPLTVHDTLIGTLNIETTTPDAFSDAHIDVAAQIGTSMALALENARLYTSAQEEIQERKKVEAALRQSEGALREHARDLAVQNAELDAFAHTVAHDLKNPLTILRGYATFLESGDVSCEEELRMVCQKIDESASRMSNIVNALLLLSKIRQSQEIDLAPLDMVQITSEVLARLEHLINEYDAEIIVPARWPVAIGYAAWIEEVWINYVTNALKYGGKPPRVELGATLQPATGETPPRVRYWVRDNGDGLTPEQQAHLFTPFERLDQARIEGDGLGLSIVHRIMNRLGGTAGVESAASPGEGSTFYFELPAAEL